MTLSFRHKGPGESRNGKATHTHTHRQSCTDTAPTHTLNQPRPLADTHTHSGAPSVPQHHTHCFTPSRVLAHTRPHSHAVPASLVP